jgi:sensor histidine kinase YesM
MFSKFFFPFLDTPALIKKVLISAVTILLSASAYAAPVPIVLTNTSKEYYVVRKYAEYYEDQQRGKKITEIAGKVPFKKISEKDLDFTNNNLTSAYWLHFYVVNHTPDLTDFIIEMYDYDINEVDLYIKDSKGSFIEKKSGLDFPFDTRDFAHKNICFKLSIPLADTTEVYMRLYSSSINVFEPVIKTHEQFYAYSLKEYVLLGVFYGFMLLIILYNFISFLILRVTHYLYYVIYAIGILIYLMSKNGTGFQYLWPDFPQINSHIDSLSLTVSIIFLSLFTMEFLQIKKQQLHLYKLFQCIICLQVIGIVLHGIICSTPIFTIFNILFIQIFFWVGYNRYKKGLKSALWFVFAFVFLNLFFLIFWLEYINWLPSSIFTVYALNIGVIVQFIFLSISITESIKDSEREKQKTTLELITTTEKNTSMRLIELKRQMNPHFIFNALNSILERILSDKKEQAVDFLMRFSKLIRNTLHYSDQIFVPLSEEIVFIENYLLLEQMRLGNSFCYTIDVAADIHTDDYEFPSFILQPFIENAIWHGLMPKSGNKTIHLKIYHHNNILHVQIMDNGVGRKAAQKKQTETHESKGITLVRERLSLIQFTYKLKTELILTDLYNDLNQASGTMIHIKIETGHE